MSITFKLLGPCREFGGILIAYCFSYLCQAIRTINGFIFDVILDFTGRCVPLLMSHLKTERLSSGLLEKRVDCSRSPCLAGGSRTEKKTTNSKKLCITFTEVKTTGSWTLVLVPQDSTHGIKKYL